MQSHQSVLPHKLLAPAPVSFTNSHALVPQHQLMASFDHLNPHGIHPRVHASDVECVESGISGMTFQERIHVFNPHQNDFSSHQNDFPIVSESDGNFSARHRPVIEQLDISSLAVSSPTLWNLQSPIQSGESSYVSTTSRNIYAHNEDARDTTVSRRVAIDSSDQPLNSPSGALSPDNHSLITPPTCSKVLLPEFSQEVCSKKLFSDVTKTNIPKATSAAIPNPTSTISPKKLSVRMKSSDGHWREWTDSVQDLAELLDLLKSNKLWNRRFACSTIWSLARPSFVARDVIRDLHGIPLLVSLIAAPSSDDELKRLAAGCIWSVCKQSSINCDLVLSCGGVDSICNLLEHGNDEQKCESIGALRNLGGCSTAIAHRIVQCNGLKLLKECVRQDRNSKIREWSARAIKEIMWP